MLIVVSRYNENIEWTKQFNNVLIINKGEKINDIDTESSMTFLGLEEQKEERQRQRVKELLEKRKQRETQSN